MFSVLTDLYALYQREHTFKYLTNALSTLDDPLWDDSWWANRKPVVKRKLTHELMELAATPPHLFDISKYKHVASPIMCVSTFPRRPFLEELRKRRQRLIRLAAAEPAKPPEPTRRQGPNKHVHEHCMIYTRSLMCLYSY